MTVNTWFSRDTVLDLVLKVVVTLCDLLLVTKLVVDLHGEAILFTQLGCQLLRALRDAGLGHLIESLELVEEFALIGDQSLLFVELFAELGKLEVLMVLLVFKFGLKGTLFVFFDLNHCLFGLDVHSQKFSLSLKFLLLLAQLVQSLEQRVDRLFARLA